MSSNPLYDLIHQGESGAAGYDAYNRGTYRDDKGITHMNPQGAHVDVSTLTIGEIQAKMALGSKDPDRLFAVGEYQIIPRTLDGAVETLNLDTKQKFTPQVQDQIYSQYLIVDKRPEVHDYITGKPGTSLQDAQTALASEWASFGDPNKNGASHYPPPNYASITLAQSESALNQMRTAYKTDIDKGMSPTDAWNAVTATDGVPAKKHAAGHATPNDLLIEGNHGTTVRNLQTQLGQLGYTDTHGRALHADGQFGPATKTAVEAFQHDHGLTTDGEVGPKTLAAIHQATKSQPAQSAPAVQTPLQLNDPTHPDNALYQQARTAVYALDAQHGRIPNQTSDNLAGALTVSAREQGLSRIDQVMLSEDATRAFAVQNKSNRPGEFFTQTAQVPTVEGLNTPMLQSSANWQQTMQQKQLEQGQVQAQTQIQNQAQTQQPSGPAMQR